MGLNAGLLPVFVVEGPSCVCLINWTSVFRVLIRGYVNLISMNLYYLHWLLEGMPFAFLVNWPSILFVLTRGCVNLVSMHAYFVI